MLLYFVDIHIQILEKIYKYTIKILACKKNCRHLFVYITLSGSLIICFVEQKLNKSSTQEAIMENNMSMTFEKFL